MVGPYFAATIVTLVQYFRLRDRRLLPLAALFAFQAQAYSREWFDVWQDVYEALACGAGLCLLLMLTLRPSAGRPPHHPGPQGGDRATNVRHASVGRPELAAGAEPERPGPHAEQ